MILSTSETPSSPKPIEDPSPQTFDDFDIEFDPSVTLENILNEPNYPNPHLEQNQPELAQVLSNIDQFDSEFQDPHIENPNTHASQPENPNIDSDTTTLIPRITEPLMVRQPLSIHYIPEIPSPYHSTPPNTPPSPIIISESPSPINPP